MSRTGRNALLLLFIGLLVAGFSLTLMAAEEGGEEGGAGDATSTTIDSGLSPAVTVGADEAAPAETDWTYRYLIPTGLVLGIIIILVTAIKYFTDVVRKRYRIIDEQ